MLDRLQQAPKGFRGTDSEVINMMSTGLMLPFIIKAYMKLVLLGSFRRNKQIRGATA